MELLISLFIVGFTAAALPGMVQVSVFLYGLEGEFKEAAKVAFGAALIDGFFILLAYFGVLSLVAGFYPIKITIGIFGFVYMFYVGTRELFSVLRKKEQKEIKKLKGFWSGSLLVLLNVGTIFYYIGVAGSIFQEKVFWLKVFFGALSLSFGALTFFGLVVLLAWFLKQKATYFIVKMRIFSAGLLIYFSLKTLLNLF